MLMATTLALGLIFAGCSGETGNGGAPGGRPGGSGRGGPGGQRPGGGEGAAVPVEVA